MLEGILMDLVGLMVGMCTSKEFGRMELEFCPEKELCMCHIHGLRERKRGR